MKCPNCKNELILPNRAYLNLQSYNPGGSVLVASECCNTGFILSMNVSYKIAEYTGDSEEDNWGVKLHKP